MKSVIEDIKQGQFKKVYLLFGDEVYLKLQYRDRLVKALMPEEDSMNYAHYTGKGLSEGEIIDLAETMPFFAERRVIVLEDTGFFKNAVDKLPDYIRELPDYLVMIFVEQEADKRSRMYKAVQKAGRTAQFGAQDEKTLMQWIAGLLKKENKNITRADAEYLLTHTGTDMSNIASEVEKLICYAWDRPVITREDMDAVCTEQMESRVFEMVRAVTERDQERALSLYYDLLALKEPPMRILYLIARQYNQMLQVKELTGRGCGQQEIAGKLGLQNFIVRNLQNCVRPYTSRQLADILRDCTQTEEDVKTGRLTDILSVELLIVRYSNKNKE